MNHSGFVFKSHLFDSLRRQMVCQPAFTFSESTIKTPKNVGNLVEVNNIKTEWRQWHVALFSSLSTLNIFNTLVLSSVSVVNNDQV